MYSREVYLFYLRAYGKTFGWIRWIHFLLGIVLLAIVSRPSLIPGEVVARYRNRIISCLLACFWTWTGLVFHLMFFAQFNYAAYGFLGVFLAESLLFLFMGTVFGRIEYDGISNKSTESGRSRVFWTGVGIFIFSLTIIPVLLLAGGESITFFGWGAEATATGTLGLLLLVPNRRSAYLLLMVPFFYSLWSFLRAQEFGLLEQYWLFPIPLLILTLKLYDDLKLRKNKAP